MNKQPIPTSLSGPAALEINSVLRNTYLLLSLTLLFSAAIAYYAMTSFVAPISPVLFIVGAIGLQMLTLALRNSSLGLIAIFGFTGFMGYSIGPMLNFYIHNFSNGTQIVTTALGATAAIFLGLSAYTVTNRKNYSYMGGFIVAASLGLFAMMILGLVFRSEMLVVLISGGFCLISSGYILYTTSAIIHGGERNYICATISLYVALFNLFVSLLRILSYFQGGNRR